MKRSFTRFYTLFLFLVLSSFSIVYSQCGPLTTSFNHDNGQDGCMFDIVALNPVIITGVEMNFDPGTYTIEIYSRPGTHVGFENSAVGWNLEGTTSVTCVAAGQATNIPITLSLNACPGQTVGLYVTCTNGNTNYTNGTGVGNVLAADANIQILEGTGKQYPFDLSFTPRAFNGTIHYTCVPPSCPTANAGPDQTICGTNSATMAGSTCGEWSVVSGTGTFSDINDPNATVTGLSPGANVFEWSTSCPTTTDQVTINFSTGPDVDPLADQTVCDSYTLPAITGTNLTGNEAYFTATGGGGTQYNAGQTITASTTLFIYDETGGSPNCFDEETFDITVNTSPDIDPIANMNGCGSITFPAITGTNLTGNEAYYTGPGGTGTQYTAGSNFTTTGTTTIYIYDETGSTPNCFDEESFDVTVNAGPTVDDLPDQTVCDSYTLPAITGTSLTGNEAYYTATGGGGTQYNAGDMITTSGTTTLYIYDASGPSCTSEEMVDITVNISPDVDPMTNQTVCDSYTLPAITGTNLTGNEAYYTATGGGGTQYNAGDMITTSGTTTLYIYDAAGTCTDEETFDVTVNITPDVDPQNDVTVCGSYTFAAITGTNLTGNEAYFTGPGGTGTQYNPGDNITTAGANTIYIYDASGSCTDEETFTVTIGTTLAITITYTDPTTCGGTDGSITISGVLSNTPYNVEYTENGTTIGPNSITSNGSGELIISGLGAGDYSDFVVEYAGCTGTDNTVYTLVEPATPTVNITGNEMVCEGETVTLATDLTGSHTWSDNSTSNTLDVTTAGTYWVDVDDGTGCIASDTVEVEFSEDIILDITPIAESCIDAEDGTVEVEVIQGTEPFTYSWLNGSNEETPIFAPGIYTVTVTNDYGCSYSDTVDIEAATEECTDPSIYIPNIFSPNGDGVNDVFEVYGTDITQLSVQIFDRWGKLVFYSTDVEAAWDGTKNGKPMNTAVFAYLIRVTFAGNYQEEYKGNVTLVRKK